MSEAAASFEDDETAYSIETVNEFSYIKTVKAGTALRPYVLLAQRILDDETLSDAERWENVAAVWRSVLDIRYAELTDASEGSLASLLAAERAAFLIYADARGALYRLVYSDEAVAAELVARLIEEKTVQMSK